MPLQHGPQASALSQQLPHHLVLVEPDIPDRNLTDIKIISVQHRPIGQSYQAKDIPIVWLFQLRNAGATAHDQLVTIEQNGSLQQKET